MKLFFPLSALFAIVFLSSCQKEISGETNSANSDSSQYRVKTYTEEVNSSVYGNSVTTYNLSYDADGRLINMVSASSPGDKFVYQYGSSNSFTMDLYNANAISIHEIFFTNSLLLLDSTLQYNDTKDTSTEKYLYNSQGQCTMLKEYDYSTATGAVLSNQHQYTYDSNNNMLTDKTDDESYSYEYDNSLANTLDMGNVYTFRNKNLPVKTTYTSGGETITLTHVYTFDDKKRLSTEMITANTGDTVKKTYTY